MRHTETFWSKITGKKRSVLVVRGWLGQYLYVDIERDLVIVHPYDIAKGTNRSWVSFPNFESLADQLIQ